LNPLSYAVKESKPAYPFSGNRDMDEVSKRPVRANRCLLISLVIHTLFVGGILLCGAHAVRNADPVVLFLTPEPGGGGGGGSQPREEAKASHTRVRPAMRAHRQVSRSASFTKALRERTTPPPVIPAASSEATVVPAQAEPQKSNLPLSPSPSSEASLYAEGTGSGKGIGSGSGSGVGAGTGSGSGGGSGVGAGDSAGAGHGSADYLEALRDRYRREHFAYIRDLILKNLEYPPLARKMGWQGALTVSFVVRETGQAERIRILRSSGHEVLDRNVVQTIKEVQPFPRPPVRAELRIPVVYRLE
jgi:periplasmic protein TonB